MSSSDWWTSSTTNSTTPQRNPQPLQSQPYNPTLSHRARFAGDELDNEDMRMAESVRFGSLGNKGSPGVGLSMSMGSVGGGGGSGTGGLSVGSPRRSPTHRFSMGDGSSPRNARTPRPSQPAPEDDQPPTTSLHDISSPPPATSQPTTSYPNLSLYPAPPTLTPSPNTTTLQIFGPPHHILASLTPFLTLCGPLKAYIPGPEGTNWWYATYESPIGASYLIRKHGEIIQGRYMLGVKVLGDNEVIVMNSVGSSGEGEAQRRGGWEGVLEVKNGDIMKKKDGEVAKKGSGGDLGWDEADRPSGMMSKAAEWLFGR